MTSEQEDAANQYFVHTEAGWWDRFRPKVHPVPPAANENLQKYNDYIEQIQELRGKVIAFQNKMQNIKADISAKDDEILELKKNVQEKDVEIKQLRQIDEYAIQKKEEVITQIEDYKKLNSKLIQRNDWLESTLRETTQTTINNPITEWQQAALLKQRQQIKFLCRLLELIRHSMQDSVQTSEEFVRDCQEKIKSFENLNTKIDKEPTTFSYTDLHEEQRQWIYKAESFLASCYASIRKSELSKWLWLESYFQTIAGQDKKLQLQKNAEVRKYKKEQVEKQKDFMKQHPMKPYEPYQPYPS
jgi:hypothetical protein